MLQISDYEVILETSTQAKNSVRNSLFSCKEANLKPRDWNQCGAWLCVTGSRHLSAMAVDLFTLWHKMFWLLPKTTLRIASW